MSRRFHWRKTANSAGKRKRDLDETHVDPALPGTKRMKLTGADSIPAEIRIRVMKDLVEKYSQDIEPRRKHSSYHEDFSDHEARISDAACDGLRSAALISREWRGPAYEMLYHSVQIDAFDEREPIKAPRWVQTQPILAQLVRHVKVRVMPVMNHPFIHEGEIEAWRVSTDELLQEAGVPEANRRHIFDLWRDCVAYPMSLQRHLDGRPQLAAMIAEFINTYLPNVRHVEIVEDKSLVELSEALKQELKLWPGAHKWWFFEWEADHWEPEVIKGAAAAIQSEVYARLTGNITGLHLIGAILPSSAEFLDELNGETGPFVDQEYFQETTLGQPPLPKRLADNLQYLAIHSSTMWFEHFDKYLIDVHPRVTARAKEKGWTDKRKAEMNYWVTMLETLPKLKTLYIDGQDQVVDGINEVQDFVIDLFACWSGPITNLRIEDADIQRETILSILALPNLRYLNLAHSDSHERFAGAIEDWSEFIYDVKMEQLRLGVRNHEKLEVVIDSMIEPYYEHWVERALACDPKDIRGLLREAEEMRELERLVHAAREKRGIWSR